MRETLTEIAAAGAFLLSPHPAEQPAIKPAVPIEMVIDQNTLAAAQDTLTENAEALPADRGPVKDAADFLHAKSDTQSPSHEDGTYNVAIFESLDPNTVSFWLEVVGSGLGLGGASGFVASRRLKKSVRRRHAGIKDKGWEAQGELNYALEAAQQQAAGLHDDDVPEFRSSVDSSRKPIQPQPACSMH